RHAHRAGPARRLRAAFLAARARLAGGTQAGLGPRGPKASDVAVILEPPRRDDFSVRSVLRVVMTVVAVVIALYLIFLLRRPLTWIFIAGFLAIALSGPVTFLQRWMKRGLAMVIVYVALILVPVLIVAALVPPIVTQGNNLVQSLPGYANDLQDYV